MFVCKLCNEGLHSTSKILGTYCGHAFHQICLDIHLNKSVNNCPTCKKSLKVNMALLATLSHNFAILPLHLDERNSKRIDFDNLIRKITHENAILKQKIVELTRAIISLQDEKRRIHLPNEIIYDYESTISTTHFKETPALEIGIKRSINEEKPIPYKATFTENHFSESVAQWTDALQSLSEREKDRILRSKRREYLTWRNKVQTWLTKMEKASDKLLKAEACFTEQEYITQLLLFLNKFSLQGKIVETAKQASLIYLIISDEPRTEKEAIQQNMQNITSVYEEIFMKIRSRLDTLSASRGSVGSPTISLLTQRRDMLTTDESINTLNPPVVDTHKGWVPTVSKNPSFYKTGAFAAVKILLSDEDISFQEPVFV